MQLIDMLVLYVDMSEIMICRLVGSRYMDKLHCIKFLCVECVCK